MIPIRNLYYLLCYAWHRLDHGSLVDVEALPRQDLPNLLARVLVRGLHRLQRQGMDRVYVGASIETLSPRGKIDVGQTLKRGLLIRNAVACSVDELSRDVLHNQILKATLSRLALARELDSGLAHQLRTLYREMAEISDISLRAEHFSRVQLHRNNGFYRFLLHICQLCFFALLPDEAGSGYRFQDFVRDENRMRAVFQDFIYNFYDLEQRAFKVRSQQLEWDLSFADAGARALLPQMRTDVCLESETRKIVIECKFTPTVLQEHWSKLSARSEHLYQLFTYLKQLEGKGGINRHSDGLLLYPTVAHPVDMTFQTQGHTVRVFTVDLRQEWPVIRQTLLGLLQDWGPVELRTPHAAMPA